MAGDIVFKDKEMKKFLKGLQKNTDDVKKRRKAWVGVVSSEVFKDIVTHFEKEEGPSGSWSKWSKGYQKSLKKKGRSGNQILQFSGKLKQSIAPIEQGGSWRKTFTGLLWFTNAKTKKGFAYAKHHDEGKSDGKKPRPFMWLSDSGLNKIRNITLKHLVK